MSPHLFFILFLIAVALVGTGVVLFFTLKPKKKASDVITREEVKIFFGDSPLQEVIRSLKERLKKEYRCQKCQGRRYESSQFDADLFEVYCLSCGFKDFYHIDLITGLDRPTKKTKSPWPKELLKNTIGTPCPQCQKREYADFKMTMDVKYKFGGFGDRKWVQLYLSSCRSCGRVNFYDRARA